MIEIQNLSKSYRTASGQVEALKDVSITIGSGDIYGIIGMSGAGKSTLVRCINMLERPSQGRVLLDGQDLGSLSPTALRQVRRSRSPGIPAWISRPEEGGQPAGNQRNQLFHTYTVTSRNQSGPAGLFFPTHSRYVHYTTICVQKSTPIWIFLHGLRKKPSAGRVSLEKCRLCRKKRG